MQAFEGADMYVNQNDNGTGTGSGSSPNRQIGSVASDGTGYLVEQAGAPWTHLQRHEPAVLHVDRRQHLRLAGGHHRPDQPGLGHGRGVGLQPGRRRHQDGLGQWYFTAPAAPHFAPAGGDTQVVGYQCSVDGGTFTACTSPSSVTGLADGNHTVSVKQIDTANNIGTLVTTKAWTVDTTVPAAPSTDSEPVDTVATDARLEFTTPAGLTAECALDGAAYRACASPVDVSGLSVGPHTLQLRMVNAAGTAGAARSITWDVKAPVVAPTTPTAPTTPRPRRRPRRRRPRRGSRSPSHRLGDR